jgi:hypothetical protein
VPRLLLLWLQGFLHFSCPSGRGTEAIPSCADGIVPVYLRVCFHHLNFCNSSPSDVLHFAVEYRIIIRPRQIVGRQKQNANLRFVYKLLSFHGGSCSTAVVFSAVTPCRIFSSSEMMDQTQCATQCRNPKDNQPEI